jgi:uncharacterized membrane protein
LTGKVLARSQSAKSEFSSPNRIELIDFARGMALIAMTLFHFGWDLEMFGFAGRGFASQPAMIWFARCIATSFLFLVGVGLLLAHFREFNQAGFLVRLAKVGSAALLITIATRIATPDIFIFFGILHHIAVASVLGLLFLPMAWWTNALAAFGVLAAYLNLRTPALDAPWWWWTGLSEYLPRSSDYVPIFPFFAAVLAGMAIARLALDAGWLEPLAKIRLDHLPGRLLKFIGRHSLIYYLVHQPIMIGILFLIHWLVR